MTEHILVSEELLDKAKAAFWDTLNSGPMRDADAGTLLRAALDAVADELWQAGYDAGKRATIPEPR